MVSDPGDQTQDVFHLRGNRGRNRVFAGQGAGLGLLQALTPACDEALHLRHVARVGHGLAFLAATNFLDGVTDAYEEIVFDG